jgi:hypothetical protein
MLKLSCLMAVTLLALRRRMDARSERGSVTLEQVAIAAGLLTIALAAVAVIGTAVVKYTNLLN